MKQIINIFNGNYTSLYFASQTANMFLKSVFLNEITNKGNLNFDFDELLVSESKISLGKKGSENKTLIRLGDLTSEILNDVIDPFTKTHDIYILGDGSSFLNSNELESSSCASNEVTEILPGVFENKVTALANIKTTYFYHTNGKKDLTWLVNVLFGFKLPYLEYLAIFLENNEEDINDYLVGLAVSKNIGNYNWIKEFDPDKPWYAELAEGGELLYEKFDSYNACGETVFLVDELKGLSDQLIDKYFKLLADPDYVYLTHIDGVDTGIAKVNPDGTETPIETVIYKLRVYDAQNNVWKKVSLPILDEELDSIAEPNISKKRVESCVRVTERISNFKLNDF